MDRRMRDGRNPYGSRGGYVDSTRGHRMDYAGYHGRSHRGDYARTHTRGYADRDVEGQVYREPCIRYSNSAYGVPVNSMEDGRRYDRANRIQRDYGYDGHEYRPIEVMGRFGGYYSMDEEDYARGNYNRDYRGYDYGGYGMDYAMDEQELKYFEEKLVKQLEPNTKTMFEKHNVLSKAKAMNINFDNYSENEFYVVVLMMFTDFGKTLGAGNVDVYVRMAKDWLEDKDSNLKYSDKLFEYLEKIVDAE